MHQRPEVIPLDIRGVLELIQEEIFIAHAHFLVDERRIGSVDDTVQDGIGIVQREHILLLLNLRKRFPQFLRHAQTVQLPLDNLRGRVFLISRAEECKIRVQRPFQHRLYDREQPGLGFGEPLLGIFGLFHERIRGLDGTVQVFGYGAQEAPVEVRELHAHALQSLLHGFHRRFQLLGIRFDDLFAADAEPVHGLLVILNLPFRNLEQIPGYGLEAVFQADAALFLQVLLCTAGEPVQKRRVFFRQPVQHAVYTLGDEGIPVHLYLVGGKLANLP